MTVTPVGETLGCSGPRGGGYLNLVMPGLVPGIHVFARPDAGVWKVVDGRDKPGHDD